MTEIAESRAGPPASVAAMSSSRPLAGSIDEARVSAGGSSTPHYGGGGGGGGMGSSDKDAGTALLVEFYTRTYPTADELRMDLDELEPQELAEMVQELRTEVGALREETSMLEYNVAQLRARAPGAVSRGSEAGNPTAAGEAPAGAGGSQSRKRSTSTDNVNMDHLDNSGVSGSSLGAMRRGRGYRRRSQGEGDGLVAVAEKTAMLTKHRERLREDEEKAARQAENVQELLTATVEEAQRRLQELRLEFRQFSREVLKSGPGAAAASSTGAAARATSGTTTTTTLPDGSVAAHGNACADDLLLYMQHRIQAEHSYLDKLSVQCRAAEQSIARAQQQVRQRRAAGEAFNAVDFAQLRIENEQFNERIEKKNAELAELKSASTSSVQTLNSLMNALNDLSTEQAVLRKELRSRGEYLARCSKDVTVVAGEAAVAEKKNRTIKAQHEAVKVPKIEEYIAQTAELFELQKACQNWSRKVEIAEGQVGVLRQQTRRLGSQRDAAVAYAESKKQQRQAQAQAQAQLQERRQTLSSRVSVAGRGGGRGVAAAAAATSAAPQAEKKRVSGGGAAAARGSGKGGRVSDAQPTPTSTPAVAVAAPTAAEESRGAAAPLQADGPAGGSPLSHAPDTATDGVGEATEEASTIAAEHAARAVAPTLAPPSPSREQFDEERRASASLGPLE